MADARVDDLVIHYEDVGQGEPALLCLPGWCAGRGAFDAFAALLAPRRRVLSPDWRGHGRSDRAPGDFGIEQLIADALGVIAASGAQQIVPVATAHAGWVATELRRRLGPERVPKLILIDWIVTAAPPPFLAGLAALQDPARWKETRDRLFGMWLEGVDHAGVTRFVHDDMGSYDFDMWGRAGREIAAAYARGGTPLDELSRLSPPPPTLHLYAQPADPAFAAAQTAFSAAHPWYLHARVDGKSHFPTIEIPQLLIDPIERFLG